MAKYLRFQMVDGLDIYQDVKIDTTTMLWARNSTQRVFIDENGNENGFIVYTLNQDDNVENIDQSAMVYLQNEIKTLMEMDNDSPTQDKAIYRTIPFKLPISPRSQECVDNTWQLWVVNGEFTGDTLTGVNITDPLGNPLPDVGQVVLGSAIPAEAGTGLLGVLDNSPCARGSNLDVAFIENPAGEIEPGEEVPGLAGYYWVGAAFNAPGGDDSDDDSSDGATWQVASKKVINTTEFTGSIRFGNIEVGDV